MQSTAEPVAPALPPTPDIPSDVVIPTDIPVSTDVSVPAEFGVFELLIGVVSLLILLAFLSSLWKWVALIIQGKRLFGTNPLVRLRARPRPYWSVIHAGVFYGFVIVASVIMSGIASAVGWIDLKALAEEDSPISVAQLLISSTAMLAATVLTMLIALPLKPRLAERVDEGTADDELVEHERPGFGWRFQRGDVSLGLLAAWLILPPTMLMMGAVSAFQEYSHPVLDALKPDDPNQGPNYAIFIALFFTTAIVTPIVEEFWFRGLLQGGLQRLADASGDTRRWFLQHNKDCFETAGGDSEDVQTVSELETDQIETGNPFQSPYEDPAVSLTSADNVVPNSGTRTDWTPTAVWPMIVASLLFALAHWGQGLAPIPLFFLSMGLGYLYRQTGSLIPPITVHFVLNGFTMSATLLEMLK